MYKIWQPMKYATATKKELLAAALESEEYCLQLKKDGASYTLAKDTDGSVHLYSDRISKVTGEIIDKIENVPHIKEWAAENLPPETQICVEILYGRKSNDVSKIMGCLPPKAIARQEETYPVKAYVFDFLYWGGDELYKLDFAERWTQGLEYLALYDEPEWLTIAETVFVDKANKIAEWLNAGEEGGVLKLLRSTKKVSAAHAVREMGATPARPMHTTYKIKQIDTSDVVIMGHTLPDKKYQGKNPDTYEFRDEEGNPVNRLWYLGYFNAFIIGAYDNGELKQIGSVASGLNDEIRSQDPESYVGQVIEVVCMEKNNADHTLRHPRFIRFRDDKTAENCVIEEIFR